MLQIHLDRSAQHHPYYLQITEQVRAVIATGELTAGYRLPSSRQLARELGLSRRTVVLAFEELCAQGYCISITGHGTTVAEIPVLKQSYAALSPHSFPQWLALELCPEFFNSQLLVAELLESGTIERHLRRMRISYRRRRDLIAAYLLQTFPQWQWQLPQGGMQFWIELPPHELADTVLERWIQRGIRLHSAKLHYEQSSQESLLHLILGFGSVSEAQIHQAFKRLLQLTEGGTC